MREHAWDVIGEAAVCFSLPTWVLTAEYAWPANHPLHFAAAVVLGASLALVLFHVVPAVRTRQALEADSPRIPKPILWIVAAWLSTGAFAGVLHVRLLAPALRGGLFYTVTPALLVAWAWPRLQGGILALCAALGAAVALAGFVAQSPGLWTTNQQFSSEARLGDSLQVFEGMLLAATPAAILALRIGRRRPSGRTIWWTGVCGLWAPLTASVVLMSLAKMCGARLYWRPSLPIDTVFGLVWIAVRLHAPEARWPIAALTCAGPSIVSAIWIKELTDAWRPRLLKWLVLVGLAVAGSYAVFDLGGWDFSHESPYWLPWAGSVILASVVAWLWWCFERARR
jgi:hypothetical protein